jgi:hypothetical protein
MDEKSFVFILAAVGRECRICFEKVVIIIRPAIVEGGGDTKIQNQKSETVSIFLNGRRS